MKILNQGVKASGEINPNAGSNKQYAPAQAGGFSTAKVIKSKVVSETVKSSAAHQIL